MKRPTTQEEKFLTWCKVKGLKFRRTGSETTARTYDLNYNQDMVLVVQGVTLKLNPMQNSNALTVYFTENGKWTGGTNMIWNTGLPWEDA